MDHSHDQEPAQSQQGSAVTRDKAWPVPPTNRASGGLVGPCGQAPGGRVGQRPLGKVALEVGGGWWAGGAAVGPTRAEGVRRQSQAAGHMEGPGRGCWESWECL